MWIETTGFITFCILTCVEALQYNSQGNLKEPWIKPISVNVTSDPDNCNVTVIFKALGPVEVRWTIDDGFSPTDLNQRTHLSMDIKDSNMAAKISIPFQLQLDGLMLHIMSKKHSFEIHLELDVHHGMMNMFNAIDPYTLFVPADTEIGISSRGETQFHVFTNTTGTPFIFGMLQADVTSIANGKGNHVQYDVAYSFLPDNKASKVRLKRRIDTETEYHTDVVLKAPEVYQNGGIITITAACTSSNFIVRRLDIKQFLYLQPKPGTLPVSKNSVGFVEMSGPRDIIVAEFGKVLIRCKAVGNPTPRISLYKKNGRSSEIFTTPSYFSSQKYETLAVFQFLNVTSETSGNYFCRAFVGDKNTDAGYSISVSTDLKDLKHDTSSKF